MFLLRGFVRYGATPVFVVLAALQYLAAQAGSPHMAMMDMPGMAPHIAFGGYALPGTAAGIVTAMWLMYALMGLFHSGPWLDLMKGPPRRKDAGATHSH